MQKEKSCGAIITKLQNEKRLILLIKHINGGHWAFPKGHVENDESEAETALREIQEETGLLATLDTKFRTVITYSPKKNVLKDVVYFAATAISGHLTAQPEEIEQIRWVEIETAESFIQHESDRAVLRAFRKYIEL